MTKDDAVQRVILAEVAVKLVASISWKGVGKGFGEKEGCSSKNLYTGCYSGIGRRTDKGWAWRSARFLWYWLQPPIQVHKQGQIYPSPRLHPPPPFPISSSPSNDPLPASTLYLISTLLFFFSFPPFCPVSLLLPSPSLPAGIFLSPQAVGSPVSQAE